MSNELSNLISKFTSDIEAAIRQSTLDAVTSALGGEAPAKKASNGAAANGTSNGVAHAAPKAPKSGARAPGEKRDPKELAKLVERVASYITKHPGLGIESIGKALETPTKDLTLPIKKLLGEKRIASKGKKRATRYTSRG